MMRRKFRVLLGAVAAGTVLMAGRTPEGRAALTYDFSVGAGTFVNDNFYLDPESGAEGQRKPVSETTFTVAPEFNLDWAGQHDHLSGSYSGNYVQFAGDEDLDPRWMHDLSANLGWRRWNPFFLEVHETLSLGPTAQERDVQALIDYTYTNMVSARTGMVWELGARGSVELGYRGELETYPQVEDADRVLRQYGEGVASYRWSPLWSTEFSVSYGQVDRKLTADYTELSVSAAVDQRLSEHLALRYGLEWNRDAYEAAPGGGEVPGAAGTTESSWLKSVEISGDLSVGGQWNLGYEDTLDYLPDGDTIETGRASAGVDLRARLGSTLAVEGWHETRDYRVSDRAETAWGSTLDARWMIRPWAAFDLLGEWTNTTIREEASPEIEERTARAAAGILFLALQHLQLEAGCDYRSNDSSDAQRSYTGSRVYAFATYYFRPPAPGTLPSSHLSGFD